MRKQIAYIVAFLLTVFSFPLSAQEKADGEGEKAFDPKETIFEHLLDGYGWELPFSHEHKIPLPVIVRDYKGDWKIFGSHRLEHGQTYEGFYVAQDGPNKGKVESVDDRGNRYRPLDLSITKNVLALIIAAFICGWCVLSVAHWYRKKRFKAPKKGVGAIEFLIEFVYTGVIKSTLGDKAPRFAPYLLTVFFFILLMNLLGLIVIFPGGANLTGNIAVTMVLALCTFIVVNVRGTKEYWLSRCTVVVEVSVTYHALDRGVRNIYQTGGFDGAFVCQYDGRAYDYIVAYIAHFHFWSIRSGCYRGNDSRIGVVLFVYVAYRYVGIVYSSLCVYHAFDSVHSFGTSRWAS